MINQEQLLEIHVLYRQGHSYKEKLTSAQEGLLSTRESRVSAK